MKRLCPRCRTTKWKRESDGSYACEYGHRLEGHQVEEGDTDALVGSVLMKRKGGAAPKRKREETIHRTHLKGPSGQDLLLQAMQLILRKQLFALIHDLGFPPELEEVAREYWILYVSLINTYQDKPVSNPDTTDNQNSSMNGNDDQSPRQSGPGSEEDHSMFKDKATIEESDTDGVEAIGGHKGYDTDHSEPSSENPEEDEEEEEDDDDDDDDDVASLHGDHKKNGTDAVGANKEDEPEHEHGGESEGESEGGTPASASSRKKRIRGKPKVRRSPRYLSIIFTIVICYFSAIYLKLPVVLGDFCRWALQRKIPYYGAFFDLPAKMTRRISYGFKSHLHPMDREPSKFHTAAANLDLLLRRSFGIHSNLPNIPALTLRFVQELMLPVEVYPCALSLSRILFDKERVRSRVPLKGSNYVMAMVVVVAKLFLGLDGKKRFGKNNQSWVDAMPKEKEWIESLDVFHGVQVQTNLRGAFAELEELMEVNPGLYTDHAISELRFSTAPLLPDLISAFNTTDYDQKVQENPDNEDVSPAMEAFIKRLHANVKPPTVEHDDMAPPPLEHGEGFVHYMSNGTGAYLGKFGRLVSYASDVLAVHPRILQGYITTVEQNIVVERRSNHVQIIGVNGWIK